jgi:hypothetical protein
MRLVEMGLLVELVFDTCAYSMELQSFEKLYGTLLTSSNWASGEPILISKSAFVRQNSRKSAKSTPVRRTFSHSSIRLRRKP